jgi:SSS family solute:Na+ symporter
MPDGVTPVIPEGTSPNAVLGMMVGKLATPIIGGLVTAGIMAAIMSSLDSQFVAVGTMFTKDIVVHFFGIDRFSEKQKVLLARGFICTIVFVTYLFTLAEPRSVFSLGIWCFSGFAGLFPLVFAAIYWRKATKAGAYAAVIGSALSWFFLFRESDYGANGSYLVGGVMPVAVIFVTCAICMVVVSLFTQAPSQDTLDKFFKKKA